MILTKQDIQNIANRLSMLGRKDSSFPKAVKSEIDENALIPIVCNGVNKTVGLGLFSERVHEQGIPISVKGLVSGTLNDALTEILTKIGEFNPENLPKTINESAISCYHTISWGGSSQLYTKWPELIGSIITAITELKAAMTLAEEKDINDILNK